MAADEVRSQGKLTTGLALRWDDFVGSQPRASLYHHSRWVAFAADVFGFEAAWLAHESAAGQIAGVLPMIRQRSRLFGDRWVSLPFFNYGGPVAVDTEATAALITLAADYARQSGVRQLEIRGAEQFAGFACRSDKATLILELPSTIAALAEQLGAKLRSQIRRSDRETPEVVIGGANLVGEFYLVFAATMRDVGTPVLARYFFERMFERVGEDCRIVIVRLAGHTAAAALLTQHGDTVEIPWAGNLRRFRPAAANMRLYWECLKYAVETGHRRFDFGRSTVDSGTYHFKEQWGARPVALHWLYPLQSAGSVIATQERPVLKLARVVWGKLPVSAATRLAASFSAGLPW